MVGPFAQGFFLIGIIYWYSKGLMNLINDYYRTEFNRKLKTTAIDPRNHHNELRPQSYDLDDMEQLIKMESLRDREGGRSQDVVGGMEGHRRYDYGCLKNETVDDGRQCYRPNRKVEFLNILFQFDDIRVCRKHVYFDFNYPTCLLNNENVT